MPENMHYIVAAYAVTWAVFIGYAVRLHLVSRRAHAQYAHAMHASEEEGS